MPVRTSRTLAALAVAGSLVLAGLFMAAPAQAVEPDEYGVYPSWTTSGSSGAFTATASFPASAGMPVVTVTSNASSFSSPSGASSWMNGSTSFGTEFGPSRLQPYLLVPTAPGLQNSVTTLSFDGDPQPGWGFALGDIDADWVFIQAWADDARTIPLTLPQLGFQTAGNFCIGSPRPSACSTPGLAFESPVWVTAPETFDGINYVPGTLRGNTLVPPQTTLDSAGAYAWFAPTVPVRHIDLTFGLRAGIPNYSITLAAPAPKVVISGTVTIPDTPAVPPGTTIELQNQDGTPVLDIEGNPVSSPVAPDGSYSIETEQRPSYLLDPVPPPGFQDPPPFSVPADTAVVTAPAVTLLPIAPVPPPPAPEPELAASGSEGAPLTAAAGALLIAAGIALRLRRRAL